jgi:predicted metal-dependent hydrolase
MEVGSAGLEVKMPPLGLHRNERKVSITLCITIQVPVGSKARMDNLLLQGIRLFNNREFFECHEVLEQAWTPERGLRRLFLQALIHFAVGLYHWERGNLAGAARQIRKGLRKLGGYLPSCEGIDTDQLYRDGLQTLARIEAGEMPQHYLHIRLHTQID